MVFLLHVSYTCDISISVSSVIIVEQNDLHPRALREKRARLEKFFSFPHAMLRQQARR